MEKIKWKYHDHDSIFYYNLDSNLDSNSEIIAFDFDWTLVRPKSHRILPRDPDDIKLCYDNVIEKLREEHSKGKKIVIFSNQKKSNIRMLYLRLTWFVNQFPNITFIASLKNDLNRKPETGMWDFLTQNKNINLSKCCFIGDAGGRDSKGISGKDSKGISGKDFSCSDRKFAYNIGINFKTPEEYFLGEEPKDFKWGSFDPRNYIVKKNKNKLNFSHISPEIIMMVGLPASGKSTFVKKYFGEYTYINQDILKTKKKCIDNTIKALKNNDNVIIDNTNVDIQTRKEYIELAKQYNYFIRCFVIDVDINLAKHLNKVRYRLTRNSNKNIPDIAYNVLSKKYKSPSMDEGFTEVINIPFTLEFESSIHKKEFYKFS